MSADERVRPDPSSDLVETLDISVLPGPGGHVWVSAASRSAAVHGVPRAGAGVPTARKLQAMATNFTLAIEEGDPDPVEDVGSDLCELLFGEPEILRLFHQTRGVAADRGVTLLVRLLASPRQLEAVPWELTLDPDDRKRPIALAAGTHLVRAPRSRTYPLPPGALKPPLNLLIILSSPVLDGDEALFDLFEEKRNLLEALRPLEQAGLLNVDVEDHPTPENLRARVSGRRNGYHLVHFVGHARPTGLILEDRFRRCEEMSPDKVNELLRTCPDLRMVVFAGCYTAESPGQTDHSVALDEWRQALSTAHACARDACPVVIGMRTPLPVRTEWLFSRFFYRSIAAGLSVVEAVRLARTAISEDHHVGTPRLDWAVPSLILTGNGPGVLLDADAPLPPVPRHRPAMLKLNVVEEDRGFFSRLVPLRLAVDVLTAKTRNRVLFVLGPSGAGKSRLVDRALQDIEDQVDFILYARAKDLEPDPVLGLCSFVAELLTQADGKPRERNPAWKSGVEWWDRLVQELPEKRFVIALDDVDDLANATEFRRALARLASRRSLCRIALLGTEASTPMLNEIQSESGAAYPLTIYVRPLTWAEVQRWVRRNEPALARSAEDLRPLYSRLGTRLELWSRLAELVNTHPGKPLETLVEQVLLPEQHKAVVASPSRSELTRGQRPLRIAVVGASIDDDRTGAVLTAWAARYEVGGRVLIAGRDDSAALATVVPIATPFSKEGAATEEGMLRWLQRAAAAKPDIVVLAYGAPRPSERQQEMVRALCGNSLVISGFGWVGSELDYPARQNEVLAVGALDGEGAIAEYSAPDPGLQKPELFAPERLSEDLSTWARYPEQRGTPFAALRVAAAAVLLWSIRPTQSADYVKTTLVETANPLPGAGSPDWSPGSLDVKGALDQARDEEIHEALRASPSGLTMLELIGRVGFSARHLQAALGRLTASHAGKPALVFRTVTSTSELYEAVDPDPGQRSESATGAR